jgi:hypothetical protein
VDQRGHLEVVAGPGSADRTHQKLTLRTDVEQACAQAHRDSEAGEHQRCGLLHHPGQAVRIAQGGGEQHPVGGERIDPLQPDEDAADGEGEQDRSQGKDDDLGAGPRAGPQRVGVGIPEVGLRGIGHGHAESLHIGRVSEGLMSSDEGGGDPWPPPPSIRYFDAG